jgi:hypothetical protein
MNYARYRNALEKMYEDQVTVNGYRSVTTEWNETRNELVTGIYTNEPCKLSQKSLGSNSQRESFNGITYESKLFLSPNVEIRQGDELIVTRHNGSTIKYKAGEPFIYPSHQELILDREGKA